MGQEKDEILNATKAPDDESAAAKDASEVPADKPDSAPGSATIAPQDTIAPSTAAEQPQPKKQIGRYEIICLLGEGGMGQGYKAYDPSLKRYVALKILRSDEPELIERFLREARTQAQVQHEHVCKIHEVDEADGKPFISMQYIEGKTLRDASAYMPPEQARGDIHNLDRRTDVYALGATLYELLPGKPPVQGNTNADIVVKVLQDEPLPLRKLNPLVPEELQTIVMKCLEKDPERRYDTARALAEDLGRFLEGEPILAHPTSIYYRLYNKARKHKVMVIALAIAVVIGLIAL